MGRFQLDRDPIFEIHVRSDLEAPSVVRRWASQAEPVIGQVMLADLVLLLTELVANSVRHSGTSPDGRIRVHIKCEPGFARAEVVDSGAGFDPPGAFSSEGEERADGWGLFLVATIATQWGTERQAHGMKVWFELRDQ